MAGATLCIAARSGAIRPDGVEGLYHRDVRVLSRFLLTIDGTAPPLLAGTREGASRGHRVHVLAADPHDSPTAVLICQRSVGTAMHERWTVEVYDGKLDGVELCLALESDHANLLARKHNVTPTVARSWQHDGPALYADGGTFGVQVEPSGPSRIEGGMLTWLIDASPGKPWTAGVRIHPRKDRRPVTESLGSSAERAGVSSDGQAPSGKPVLGGKPALRVESPATHWARSTASALADISGLRIRVPDLGLSYIGAGAPWYMALFGRDTLLTAWSALIAGTEVALDVLEVLARYQGRRHDPTTLEQPGRILHEMRTGGASTFGLPPGQPYYGTVDASPLFVMLLGEVSRWGAQPERVAALLPAARRALEWCVTLGDLDGDGFVEYESDEGGLVNQGWKDSADSLVHADGSVASTPIALAEVQAYVWGAFRALADLEERFGDAGRGPGLRKQAADLRAAFQRAFWVPERGLVAMALDGGKRPLAVASSNMAHCLWSGLLDDWMGEAVAQRLMQPDLNATWGLRTLGSQERAYNPLGYHLGTVWPHDTGLAIAGLVRYGEVAGAVRLTQGLLTAAEHFGWRLPELFGGMDRTQVPYPVSYPVACSPQAWSAAAPLLLLRSMLRLNPDVPSGMVRVAPVLPPDVELRVHNIPLGTGSLDLHVQGTEVEVLDQPEGLEVITTVEGAGW